MSTEAESSIGSIAGDFRGAYESGLPIDAVRDRLAEGGIEAAYAVQKTNTDLWVQSGREIVGHKIGLTSKAVQAQLGVDQPDFGVLFRDMWLADDSSFGMSAVIQPRVEAEVAVVLNASLDKQGLSLADIEPSVEYVCAALEIVGSRIANWDISILDTVADNASSGLFVLGHDRVDPTSLDLAAIQMAMEVDGAVASSGTGADCLGHPFAAVLWLARKMVDVGTPLQAGDIVMSGALGPMVDFPAGCAVRAEVSGLGSVSVRRTEDAR